MYLVESEATPWLNFQSISQGIQGAQILAQCGQPDMLVSGWYKSQVYQFSEEV